MGSSTTSLLDRAGLDRKAARRRLARGLEGADDGELYLEYAQSEMLVFDNGRLKQATYNTDQGFGLRAVKEEAVGYAHSSEVSEARPSTTPASRSRLWPNALNYRMMAFAARY